MLSANPVPAADLLGAPAIIRQLTATAARSASATAAAADDPAALPPSRFELAVFSALPVRTVAGWTVLLQRSLPARKPVDPAALVEALPGPAMWPDLRRVIDALPEGQGSARLRLRLRLWQVLAAVLTGDEAAALARARLLPVAPGHRSPRRHQELHQSNQQALIKALNAWARDPAHRLALAVSELELAEAGAADGQLAVVLPDLVRLVGASAAIPVIQRGLRLPETVNGEPITWRGQATRTLARRLAASAPAQLGTAPWTLIDGPEAAGALFPVLDRRFPAPPISDGHPFNERRHRAEQHWLVHLIATGRWTEARTVLKRHVDTATGIDRRTLAAAGTASLAAFLHAALAADPTLPLWREYADAAAMAGTQAAALDLMRAHADAQPIVQGDAEVALLLANDEVDRGIALLRQQLVLGLAAGREDGEPANRRCEAAVRLIRLGGLLDRPELVDAGAARLRMDLAKVEGSMRAALASAGAAALAAAGRAAQAEALLVGTLAWMVTLGDDEADDEAQGRVRLAPSILAALADLYHRLGRHRDVLDLVEQAPWWGAVDLLDIDASAPVDHGQERMPTVQVMAGEALLRAGRRAQARLCALQALGASSDDDAAYALLLAADGPRALDVLATLAKRHPLSERPLLWRAQALLDAGRIAEAATAAEQAVAMDPSDGDQGPGHRLRARAVLAAVRERQGRSAEAAALRTAVQSIRVAEDVDRLMSAGLTSRAIAGYRRALELNANAYCIQSRMGLELADLGRHEEAAAHLRKAYEIMPRAFGRMESHCFGCEGAFRGERAQRLAEEVFTGMLAKDPRHPRLHYLLAYLRQTQGRAAEAAAGFARALELDPDYFNAASKLIGLADEVDIDLAVLHRARSTMRRMDPLGEHGHLPHAQDARQLWAEAEAAVVVPELPLPTGILALRQPAAEEEAERPRPAFGPVFRSVRRAEPAKSPGDALAGHDLIEAILGAMPWP